MSVLLLGDSHLARIRSRDLHRIADEVTVRAFGGAFATDLVGQLSGLDPSSYDVLVVSVGTNDGAPWKQVPIVDFTDGLRRFLALAVGPRLLFMTSPGVDEKRAGHRTNVVLEEYADAAAGLFRALDGEVLDAPEVLSGLGTDAFTDDGVHLTAAAYDALIPALRDVIGTGRRNNRYR